MAALHLIAERGNKRFEIVEGGGEGFFVLRYLDGKDTHDYLQDDEAMAKRCAAHQWGVPLSAWRPISQDEHGT